MTVSGKNQIVVKNPLNLIELSTLRSGPGIVIDLLIRVKSLVDSLTVFVVLPIAMTVLMILISYMYLICP